MNTRKEFFEELRELIKSAESNYAHGRQYIGRMKLEVAIGRIVGFIKGGLGPMRFIIKEWEAHDFMCRVIAFPSFGGYNGYVAVPKGHPSYGKDYDEIDIEVHGGVTYAKFGTDEPYYGEVLRPNPGLYWIGFDTAHAWDSKETWPIEAVIEETERMAEQLKQEAEGCE